MGTAVGTWRYYIRVVKAVARKIYIVLPSVCLMLVLMSCHAPNSSQADFNKAKQELSDSIAQTLAVKRGMITWSLTRYPCDGNPEPPSFATDIVHYQVTKEGIDAKDYYVYPKRTDLDMMKTTRSPGMIRVEGANGNLISEGTSTGIESTEHLFMLHMLAMGIDMESDISRIDVRKEGVYTIFDVTFSKKFLDEKESRVDWSEIMTAEQLEKAGDPGEAGTILNKCRTEYWRNDQSGRIEFAISSLQHTEWMKSSQKEEEKTFESIRFYTIRPGD